MTHYLEVPGGRIAYDDTTGAGPLLVLSPGMGDLRSSYRLVAPELAEAGYRVVTVDLRGHGESSVPFDEYTNSATGADLAALIRHLDAGPAVVVGHSFSGGSAVWLASEHPELVRGVVLLEAFTKPVTINAFMKQLARLVLSSPILWAMYYKSLHKGPKPADLAEHVAAMKKNLGETGRMAAARTMGLGTKDDLAGRLERVTAPALAVYGTKSPDFADPRAEAESIAAALAGTTEIVMVDGAGHYPHHEYPENTSAAILAFLGRL
ncbi:alpha/beta fold hydrolase [Nocardioides speluncae]|uniref:alpha/beta fold hydrolase n=1 Tax=Nocardioides speluncae TaxID=2670337 RepID=UPI0012B16E97|nr:alpha/beta hydrolase [Nocardioides speluncae]